MISSPVIISLWMFTFRVIACLLSKHAMNDITACVTVYRIQALEQREINSTKQNKLGKPVPTVACFDPEVNQTV